MSRRKVNFVIIALLILLGGSVALSYLFISMKPESPKRPNLELKRFVKAKTVIYTSIKSSLEAKGRVVSSNEVTLVAEASGKIEAGSVSLRKGSSFKKGQLLACIYKDEAELALKARKSRFLNTITTLLPDLKIDYPNHYNAYQDFFNEIDINKSLPPLPKNVDNKLKVFLASRNFISEYYGILQDEKKLSRHSLYAPFNGTFTQVNFEVGGYINTGGQIARMIRTDKLEIEVPVKNEQSKWIMIGDTANVYYAIGATRLQGIVVRKSDFIEANTQSRSIFLRVPNANNDKLLAGEFKTVKFPGQQIDKAMEIPRNAVFNSNEVYIVKEGKLKKRIINILKLNETTLIFNGISEGEKVVSEPLINVKENSLVGILGEDNKTKPSSKNSNQKHSKTK